MKIYLFDTASGLYEGESFESDDMLRFQEGITTIAPPIYQKGEVPVFDTEHQRWKVMPISLVRELLNSPIVNQQRNLHEHE
jgi:hypothetical protein